MKSSILLLFILLSSMMQLHAQSKNTDYLKYIDLYKDIAIQNHKKHSIPASITLAQGLLESGAGKGRLAREGNNHFGIKCHNWNGRKIFHNDDELNECFRRYSNPKDSFDDHALFLSGRDRYSQLFALNSRDYKGWARGLQSAGYATDRSYATKLIKLIEDYQLHQYDQVRFVRPSSSSKGDKQNYEVLKSGSMYYVVVKQNDSYEAIGKALGVSAKKLRTYNEVPKNFSLGKGDIVYLTKKKKRADKSIERFYYAKPGDSMHSISQLKGIQIKTLYQLNNKSEDYVLETGTLLRIR